MTREEAAKICQSIKFLMDKEDYSEAVEEALNMAIAALKQLSLPKIIIRQGEQEPSAQPFTAEQIQTMQELESAQVEKAYELGKADRPKWISCSKRLPEEGDVVLICSKIGVIDFGKRKGDKWVWLAEALWDYWQETEDLIAWMPLPEAYKESEE